MTVAFNILGPLQVVADGEPLPLPAPMQCSLLALLLINSNRFISTDRLIDELWLEEPPEGGVRTLRFHVSNLRKSLKAGSGPDPGPIVTRQGGYELVVEPSSIDAVRFEQLRNEAVAVIDRDPKLGAEKLREGLDLFRGPPLADFTSKPFADAEIQRLEELRLTALEERIAADLAVGRHSDVIGELTSLVSTYPLRENLHGQLMVALYRSGRQAEALRAYQGAQRVLGDTVGIEPLRELRELENRILLQDQDLDVLRDRLPLPDSIGRDTDIELIGREAELKDLLELHEHAAAGRKQFAVITGEAGVGKSRLAAEVARLAHEGGAIVLHGRCDQPRPKLSTQRGELSPDVAEELDEGAVQPAFRPWSEVLRYVLRAADRPHRYFGSGGRELARLVPELRDALPDLGDPLAADQASERYRLLEALIEWLDALGSRQPVVLVFEDINWADGATLAALRYISQSPARLKLLILATVRSEAADQTAAYRDYITGLTREDVIVRCELPGLGQEQVVAYLSALARHPLDRRGEDFGRHLYLHTSGNPFFVREVHRHLEDRGDFYLAKTGEWTAQVSISDLTVPGSIEDAVSERLGLLAEEARSILAAAAIIGAEFDLRVLFTAMAAPSDFVASAVDDALDANLISHIDESRGRYRFAHALVRDAIEGGIPEHRRRVLHGQIGEALESYHRESTVLPYDELSYHFAESEQPDSTERTLEHAGKAMRYALEGAATAETRLQAAEAVPLYRRALEVMERSPSNDAVDRCRVMIKLGRAERRAGERAARETLLEASRLADEIKEPELLAEAVLSNSRGMFSVVGGVDDDRVRWIRRALEEGDSIGSAETARLQAQLSAELLYAEPWGEGHRRSAEALRSARLLAQQPGATSLDRTNLLRVMNDYHALIWRPDMLVERSHLVAEMAELADDLGHPQWKWAAASFGFQSAVEQGDIHRADELLEQVVDLADVLKQPNIVQWTALRRAIRAVISGQLAESEELAMYGYRHAKAAGHADAGTFLLGELWMVRYHQDRLDEMEQQFDAAARMLPDLAVLSAGLAAIHAETGKPEQTRLALLRLPESTFSRIDQDHLAALVASSIAAAYVKDQPLSERLLSLLQPFREQFVDIGSSYHGSAAHYMGVLADCLERYEDADAHFAYATERHRELPAPPYLARTLVEWSRSLIDRDPVQAAELAEDAYQLGTRLGFPAAQRRALDVLDAVG